jgi:hypothetical protein
LLEPQGCEKIVWWLGESKGFWIQTGALFLSAIGALWIVRSREKSERRRATIEMVLHHNSDEELTQAKRLFANILTTGDGNVARFLSLKDSDELAAIMKIINTHEFICGGILEGAYDEALYKRMRCSYVIRDWNALSGFVQEFRKSRKNQTNVDEKTFFQDFETIADRWTKKPLKVHTK